MDLRVCEQYVIVKLHGCRLADLLGVVLRSDEVVSHVRAINPSGTVDVFKYRIDASRVGFFS